MNSKKIEAGVCMRSVMFGFVACIASTAYGAVADTGTIDFESRNAVDEMQLISGKIETGAWKSSGGNESSFKELAVAVEQFDEQKSVVDSALLADQLSRVDIAWQPVKRAAQVLVDAAPDLVLAQGVAEKYNRDMDIMQREFSAVARIVRDQDYGAATEAVAQQNLWLNERINRNFNALVTGEPASDKVPGEILADTTKLLGNINVLKKGDVQRGITGMEDRIAAEALSSASRRFANLSGSIEKVVGGAGQLQEAATARNTIQASAAALQTSLKGLRTAAGSLSVGGQNGGTMMSAVLGGITVLVIALLLVQFFFQRKRAAQMKRGVAEIKSALNEMSRGDLTVNVSEDNAATVDIARQINASVKRQRELVQNIHGPFEHSVEEINKIGISARGLVEKGKELTHSVGESITAATEMVRTSEDIKKSTGEAAMTSDRNCQEVAQGYGLTKDMSKASVDVRESVQETSKSAKRQGELIQSVTAAAEYIQALNTKISVVAINTRIEAEKAGEYGRPFLGIAEAIADLLREAGDEGRKIISEVRMLQNMSAENLSSMENTVGTVVTILEYIERLDSSLEEINSGSAAISSIIRSVDEAAGQSAVSALHMNSSMTQIRERNTEIGKFSESTRLGVGRLQRTMRDASESLGKFKAGGAAAQGSDTGNKLDELEPIGVAPRVYREEDMSALETSEQARASV
jgi:methyl-accepting chemotaxis protein